MAAVDAYAKWRVVRYSVQPTTATTEGPIAVRRCEEGVAKLDCTAELNASTPSCGRHSCGHLTDPSPIYSHYRISSDGAASGSGPKD
jgi:hypothetical protein